jgi:hypothetical protein
MTFIVLLVTYYLAYTGYAYYSLPLEERFYHPHYTYFKPSGIFGQGLGVIGTFLILFGVTIYIARKRYGFLEKIIRLKYLLEFHIFLCTLGPILILFHTTFKFGGIVSIAFWSMVAIVMSGVIGRFIYIQIPRTIEGRELSIQEVKDRRENIIRELQETIFFDQNILSLVLDSDISKKWGFLTIFRNWQKRRSIYRLLKTTGTSQEKKKNILDLIKEEMALTSRIGRLEQMQKLFRYWHVVHMPFAIIMLVIVLIHIIVTVSFGYKWIF